MNSALTCQLVFFFCPFTHNPPNGYSWRLFLIKETEIYSYNQFILPIIEPLIITVIKTFILTQMGVSPTINALPASGLNFTFTVQGDVISWSHSKSRQSKTLNDEADGDRKTFFILCCVLFTVILAAFYFHFFFF